LEEELGLELFSRGQRGVKLTAAGVLLREETERILLDVDRAIGRVQKLRRGEAGTLKLGVNETAARCAVAMEAIRHFQQASPDVQVEFSSMLTLDQVAALQDKSLDAGFMYTVETGADEPLEVMPIEREEMLLALCTDHPLAKKASIEIADLKGLPLAWPSHQRGRYIFDEMFRAFERAEFSPKIVIEVQTAEMTMNLVASGLTLGFVPELHVLPPSVILRPVAGFDVAMELSLVWPASADSPALKRFIVTMRNVKSGGTA
jgi:DNA-binding transcriptional LysR family regulator